MMTKLIETIGGSSSIQESAKKMKNKNVSSVMGANDNGWLQNVI